MNLNHHLLWHYTYGRSMPGLLESGMILLTGHDYPLPEAERAVWFSKNQTWETTVRKLYPKVGQLMTFVELVETFGVYRVGIEPADAPISFQQLQQLRPQLDWRPLARGSKRWGANPRDWCVSLVPVPRERWKAIQVYRIARWVDLTEAELQDFAIATPWPTLLPA